MYAVCSMQDPLRKLFLHTYFLIKSPRDDMKDIEREFVAEIDLIKLTRNLPFTIQHSLAFRKTLCEWRSVYTLAGWVGWEWWSVYTLAGPAGWLGIYFKPRRSLSRELGFWGFGVIKSESQYISIHFHRIKPTCVCKVVKSG